MKRAHGQTPCELVVLTGKTSLRTDQLLCLQLEKLPLSAEHALEKVSFC